MEATTITRKSARVRKPRTKEAFLAWEQPAGKYKYEWVDGELEKTDYMMKNTERGIVKRIRQAFYKTKAFNEGGELFAETHVPVSETRVRIPDLSFFTAEQIAASEQGALPVPTWAIELISPNEVGFKIERKALEYHKVGVQVLWQVYPDLRMVQVRTSLRSTQIYWEEDACTAAPALPDMKLKVNELFGPIG
ncbi:MAG: Uma2 family endonuclease [Tunicatimonas sp.]